MFGIGVFGGVFGVWCGSGIGIWHSCLALVFWHWRSALVLLIGASFVVWGSCMALMFDMRHEYC
jgi:hypothetical protein